jgi:hypothetical protein
MKKPVMLGAHKPKKLKSRKRSLYGCARDINSAYNEWAAKRGRADLVYFKPAFNP